FLPKLKVSRRRIERNKSYFGGLHKKYSISCSKIKTVSGVDAQTDAKPEMLPVFEQFEKVIFSRFSFPPLPFPLLPSPSFSSYNSNVNFFLGVSN
ncbi:hypothetical protein M1146_00215, partial [Patescibacteria group bacterium]|nr:hypothetical protein [Patescibacteria group bacterium]